VYSPHSRDLATYTARVLSLPKWEKKYGSHGDVKSWNEMIATAEKAEDALTDNI
jgi:hypothetical protein